MDKERIRIMVTLNKEQYKTLSKLDFYGRNDAEKMANIFISFVSLLNVSGGLDGSKRRNENTR